MATTTATTAMATPAPASAPALLPGYKKSGTASPPSTRPAYSLFTFESLFFSRSLSRSSACLPDGNQAHNDSNGGQQKKKIYMMKSASSPSQHKRHTFNKIATKETDTHS
mmetsp:Transcript_35037/g.75907  ORF Transcript_35037/g.75907 Transcript_35037/m.75907 type:complete len:110 (-) Transcript_35037:757-1086(-)